MTGKNRRPQTPVVTQATLERAKRALMADGTPFAGFRVWPDGRVDVLAGEPSDVTMPTTPEMEATAWLKANGHL